MTGLPPALDAELAFAALDLLETGVLLADADGRIIVWNDWLGRASGRDLAELRGQTLAAAFGDQGSPRLYQAVTDALTIGTSAFLSQNLNRDLLPLRQRDGSVMLHGAVVRPLLLGDQPYCLVQITDVSAAQAREKLLRERRDARFRAVVDAAADAIVTTDHGGRILWVNGAAERQFGHQAQDCVGSSIDLLVGTETARWIDPAVSSMEVTGRHADGSAIAMEVSVARWTIDGRGFITGFLRDIEERRRAQQEIAARHEAMTQLAEQTRATLDALPAAIAVLDEHGHILSTNRGWQDLAQAGEVLGGGMAIGDDFLADEAPGAGEVIGRLKSLLWDAGPAFSLDCAIEAAADLVGISGVASRQRWFRCIATSFRGGPIGCAVAMFLDITEQKLMEAALRDLNATLEARVAEEIAARQEAQAETAHAERIRALGQLAGGIAHDFNNVLQAVSGGARLIEKRRHDPANVQRMAQLIVEAADRGISITGRLLTFARRGELHAEALDLRTLFTGLTDVLAYSLGSSVMLRTRLAPDLPKLAADKGQLEAVLINLATNARDAMPGGGTVMVAAEAEIVAPGASHPAALRPGAYLRLSVSDTGGGMDEATLARAAEPFFTTKPLGEGTGLGLAMARGFATQSGGGMTVTSAVGKGTVVTMWFPQAEPARGLALPGDAGQAGEVPPGGASDRLRRVLLVDDEKLVNEVLVAGLEEYGFIVTAAEDGTRALALLAAQGEFDLMITDFAMPGINGVTLIRELHRRRPHVPAILLTGHAEASNTVVAAAAAGEFILLRKPISHHQLAARIAALHAESARAVSAAPVPPPPISPT